jgi:hypothetical protein
MPDPELQTLFHRLNNQLGIVLARAEMLEVKAVAESDRTRAGQIVTAVLDALGTVKAIRDHTGS